MSDAAPRLRVVLLGNEYPGLGPPSGGIGRYLAALADALHAADHEVHLLIADADALRHCRHGEAWRETTWRCPAVLRPWRARRWLRRQIETIAPDLVEAPNWGALSAFLPQRWPLALRISTPVRCDPQRGAARRLLAWLHHAWERRAVRRATLLIADSHAMAARAARVYRRRADAIVHHALAPKRVDPDADARDLLFVGRCDRRKGIDLLLRAWRRCAARRQGRLLHVVGAPAELASWRERATPSGLRVHGRIDDAALAALRQRCIAQVVPSRFESFGLVALEAWAGGQAPIVSRAGALPEVVGDAGLVVAARPAAIAAAIDAVCEHPALRGELVALGRRRLRQRFGIDDWIDHTLSVYRQAIGRHRRTRAR